MSDRVIPDAAPVVLEHTLKCGQNQWRCSCGAGDTYHGAVIDGRIPKLPSDHTYEVAVLQGEVLRRLRAIADHEVEALGQRASELAHEIRKLIARSA